MVTLTPRTTISFSHSGVSVISAESLVLIKISDEINIGGCVLEDGWCQLTAQDPTYPWDVPLYKSPQFDVGCVEFDPCTVTGTERPSLSDGGVKKFNIKVNVWFCPAKTNCGIHNVHTKPEMLEVDFLPQNNVYSPLPPTHLRLMRVAQFGWDARCSRVNTNIPINQSLGTFVNIGITT